MTGALAGCGGDDDDDRDADLSDIERGPADSIDTITAHEGYEASRLRDPEADVNAEIDEPEIPAVLRKIVDGRIILTESREGATAKEMCEASIVSPISTIDMDGYGDRE